MKMKTMIIMLLLQQHHSIQKLYGNIP